MKEMVKKGVVWLFAALGAALTAAGLLSSDQWTSFITPELIESVTGVMSLVVGALVAKLTNMLVGLFTPRVDPTPPVAS